MRMARSNTPSDLRGLCERCWQRIGTCLCADIGRVANRTEVLILRHAKEIWRTSNTARIASLALERCEVIEVGMRDDDRDRFEQRVRDALAQPGKSYLLYPGPVTAIPRAEETKETKEPIRLVVPDGSWRQARRMLQRVPGLAELPRISLAAPKDTALRLRRPSVADGLSTIEAIARALGAIEGEDASQHLCALYEKMVARAFPTRRRSAVGIAM